MENWAALNKFGALFPICRKAAWGSIRVEINGGIWQRRSKRRRSELENLFSSFCAKQEKKEAALAKAAIWQKMSMHTHPTPHLRQLFRYFRLVSILNNSGRRFEVLVDGWGVGGNLHDHLHPSLVFPKERILQKRQSTHTGVLFLFAVQKNFSAWWKYGNLFYPINELCFNSIFEPPASP